MEGIQVRDVILLVLIASIFNLPTLAHIQSQLLLIVKWLFPTMSKIAAWVPASFHWISPTWFALSLPILGYVAYCLCKLLFIPFEIIYEQADVGYITEGKMSKKETANYMRRIRKTGDIPPVYPNGWFHLLDSSELKKGDSKYVSALGQYLVVFRGRSGQVHILDAYCPHLGANLGVGGIVIGDCIQCPFHGWTFRGEDGKCEKIPYSEKVPEFAKTKSWPTLEKYNSIYVWYHAEDVEPWWIPENIEELERGSWAYKGKTQHKINSHIEEIPENAADVSHLHHLHVPNIASGADLRYSWDKIWSFAWQTWSAEWKALEGDEKHIGSMKVKQIAYLFGYRFSWLDVYATAKQIGPGIVYLKWEAVFGSGILIQTVTPVEPLLQKMTHHCYCRTFVPSFIANIIQQLEKIQVERDIMIWNNKTFLSRPFYTKEDQMIAKHRRWFSQFYSENSPRLTLRNEKSLEW